MRWYRINALMLKYLYITKNSLDRLADVFYWPLLDILIWGFASYFVKALSEVNIMSMVMGGIILWIFVWRSCQDLAVFVLEEFWSRNLYNLFASPMETIELVISIILFGIMKSFATFGVMALLAGIAYGFSITSIGVIPFAVSVPALLLVGWALGMFIAGLIFIFGDRVQVFAWSLVWVLQPFSCVFYPLSALPEWARNIAVLLPTTQIFENLRAVLNNGAFNWNGILYAYITGIIMVILAGVFLAHAVKHARKQGLLSRYG